jgi:two-component system, cell cycle sensor histidine kinase and response regulator CckA
VNNMPAEKNRRVLVIDDNRAIHDDFRKILSPANPTTAAFDATETALFGRSTDAVQQAPFEVDSAYQGQEGVLLVKEAVEAGRPYAMAFVDVRMPPGWDGVETTRRIWELDSNLQVVLCTAYSDYSWDEMFEKLGQRDGLLILKKPFDAVEALQLAHALTEKWWLHQQSRRKMEELEGMVAERTSELQHINHALLAEVTEHRRAEETLRESEEKFRQLADNITDVFWMTSPDLREVHYVSPAYERVWGRSAASVYVHPTEWVDAILPDERERVYATFSRLAADEPSVSAEFRIARPDGSIRWIHSRGFQIRDAAGAIIRITGIAADITERKRVEGHLFQSQKMETVGKLAGGIAHEFNTIMTTIIGHSEILLSDLPTGNPLCKNAQEIRQAADRAATLTRQLLAYGRKQILQPKVLDLTALIGDMEGMLRQLMGRDTDVRIVPSVGLKPVRIDAGQIEQVVMNIVMNAADAMPNGGKLTLETANVTLDEEYVRGFSDLKEGEYVMLAITDTGAGMSENVKARLFEPFFTTKGVGNGTGLGLAACHGIIKQSGGHIAVYSEPGRGATFKIYLPQVEQPTKALAARRDPGDLPRGTEVILVVEDDPALREMSAALLRRLGYTVWTAANGVDALKLTHQQGTGHIDLLFTDVVMPQMSGKELSDRIQALRPNTKILFASAYTENAIVHQGVLDEGVELLQKPFTPSALAVKVREVLDRPNSPKSDAAQKA